MNWSSLNATLGITQFYHVEPHPTSGNILFGGTQDNGLLNYSGSVSSPTPPTLWNGVTCGDGGWTAIDPTNPSIVYVTCTKLNPPYIRMSFNNGQLGTFQGAVTGIDPSDLSRTSFIPKLILDPNNPQTLYTPTYRVYQTTDGANTWTPISVDLTGSVSAVISAIALEEGNSNELVVGTSNGHIQLTTNATSGIGSTWTDITGTGLPNRHVTSVFVPKNLPNTVFATFSGYCGNNPNFSDTKGHVFMTTNAGVVWTDISGPTSTCSPGVTDLPNVPVNDFIDDRQDEQDAVRRHRRRGVQHNRRWRDLGAIQPWHDATPSRCVVARRTWGLSHGYRGHARARFLVHSNSDSERRHRLVYCVDRSPDHQCGNGRQPTARHADDRWAELRQRHHKNPLEWFANRSDDHFRKRQ
jgi:hypothetical protein